jgi:iron-sulfur cluster repair protein YtfE (RIC family)
MGEEMRSCERVRRQVLAEHGELRTAIARVTNANHPTRLVLATSALLDLLSEHIGHEDQILEPLLRDIDAWGPERARRLREEHAAQRAEIAKLRAELATAPPATLDWEVQHFVEQLVADMEHEEQDTLDASVLRDDCITVEFGG